MDTVPKIIYTCTVSLDLKKIAPEQLETLKKENQKSQVTITVRASNLIEALAKATEYVSTREDMVEVLAIQKAVEITVD